MTRLQIMLRSRCDTHRNEHKNMLNDRSVLKKCALYAGSECLIKVSIRVLHLHETNKRVIKE